MKLDFLGQNKIINHLTCSVKNNRLHNSYIFSGPEGLGKKDIAHFFFKLLECLNPVNNQPCNQCKNCKKINKNIFVDYIEIGLLLNEKTGNYKTKISIEQIREDILPFSKYSPVEGKYKICMINNAEKMSISAMNSILKILEEPPENFIFILITENYKMLLDTIISRCQLIKFNTIPLKLVEKNLIDFFNINEQKSKILSILSAGKIKTALKLNDDKIMKIRNEVLNLFYNHCSQKNFLNHYLLSFKLSRYIEKHELYKQNKQYLPNLVLDLVLTVLRDLLVYKQFYNKNQIINIDYLEKLNNIIKKYSIEEIETFLYNVNESYDLIQKHSRLLLVFINIFLIKKEGAEF